MWFFLNLQHLLIPFFDLSCRHTSRMYINASLLQWTAILRLPMHVHILMVYTTYLHIYTAIHMNLAAKNGGTPHLAVATEQGSVHILDTSKRVDWDVGEHTCNTRIPSQTKI